MQAAFGEHTCVQHYATTVTWQNLVPFPLHVCTDLESNILLVVSSVYMFCMLF